MRKTERIPVNDPVIERIETLLRENKGLSFFLCDAPEGDNP
jgi:hypothetical protein